MVARWKLNDIQCLDRCPLKYSLGEMLFFLPFRQGPRHAVLTVIDTEKENTMSINTGSSVLFSTHCGLASEQPAWERWQARVLKIAAVQKSKAVYYYLDRCARFLEEDAWTAFCEGTTPRAWCARLAFAKRTSMFRPVES